MILNRQHFQGFNRIVGIKLSAPVFYPTDPEGDDTLKGSIPQPQGISATEVERMIAEAVTKALDTRGAVPTPPEPPETLIALVEAEKAAKAKENGKVSDIENAVVFNMGIEKYMLDNTDYFTDDVRSVYDKLKDNKGNYTPEDYSNRAKEALARAFFTSDENIGKIPSSRQSLIRGFMGKTPDLALKDAGRAYEQLEDIIHYQREKQRADIVNGINGSATPTGDARDVQIMQNLRTHPMDRNKDKK